MLTLTKQHTAVLTIDDEPVTVHVKRLTKGEAIAFERAFMAFGAPRGSAAGTEESNIAAREFIEDSISSFVSIDPNQIEDDGRPVVTGEDLIRMFCARADVLMALYQAIYAENFLGKAQKKILRTLPFFSPGSAASMPLQNGDKQGAIADAVESSSTASSAAATAANDETPAATPKSSGDTKVH